jgi:hypothetical protein
LVGGYSLFFPVLAFCCCWENEKNFVGSGVKIRVGRVTGNQQLFLSWPYQVVRTFNE